MPNDKESKVGMGMEYPHFLLYDFWVLNEACFAITLEEQYYNFQVVTFKYQYMWCVFLPDTGYKTYNLLQTVFHLTVSCREEESTGFENRWLAL